MNKYKIIFTFILLSLVTYYCKTPEMINTNNRTNQKNAEKESEEVLNFMNLVGWNQRFIYNINKKDTWEQPDSLYRFIIKKYEKNKRINDFKYLDLFVFVDSGELIKHLRFYDDSSKKSDNFIDFYHKEFLSLNAQHPNVAVLLTEGLIKRKNKKYVTNFVKTILKNNKEFYRLVKNRWAEIKDQKINNNEEKRNLQNIELMVKNIDILENF